MGPERLTAEERERNTLGELLIFARQLGAYSRALGGWGGMSGWLVEVVRVIQSVLQ